MAQQLREALRDLADGGAPATPVPGTDLWRRGRRVRRRRQTAGVVTLLAVLAVLAVLAGGVVPLLQLEREVAPAEQDVPVGVPDQLGLPVDGTPGTRESGPPGRLALIDRATRSTGWLSEEWSVFGVTARGQEYRWLDLPNLSTELTEIVLSPDGTKVGYFLSGEPDGKTSYTDVVGWASWDAETGEVTTHLQPTRHGLLPEALVWSHDSSALLVQYAQTRTENSSSHPTAYWWDPVTDAVTPVADGARLALHQARASPEGLLAWWRRELRLFRPGHEVPEVWRLTGGDRRTALQGSQPSYAVTNASGTRTAWVAHYPKVTDPKTGQNTLLAAAVTAAADGSTVLRDVRVLVRKYQVNQVLGWVSDRRVLVAAHPKGGDGLLLSTVDVTTGTLAEAIPVRGSGPGGPWLSPDVAQEVLAEGFVPGRPPRPADTIPAALWTSLAAAGLLLFLVLVIRNSPGVRR